MSGRVVSFPRSGTVLDSFVCLCGAVIASGLSLSPEPPTMLSHIVTVAGPDPRRALLVKQYSKPVDYDDEPTVAEVSLPWRREGGRSSAYQ